jgi:hypothetical protein
LLTADHNITLTSSQLRSFGVTSFIRAAATFAASSLTKKDTRSTAWESARAKAENSTATPALRLHFDELQGGLDPNKISGVGTDLGLRVHFLPGPNEQREAKPGILLS